MGPKRMPQHKDRIKAYEQKQISMRAAVTLLRSMEIDFAQKFGMTKDPLEVELKSQVSQKTSFLSPKLIIRGLKPTEFAQCCSTIMDQQQQYPFRKRDENSHFPITDSLEHVIFTLYKNSGHLFSSTQQFAIVLKLCFNRRRLLSFELNNLIDEGKQFLFTSFSKFLNPSFKNEQINNEQHFHPQEMPTSGVLSQAVKLLKNDLAYKEEAQLLALLQKRSNKQSVSKIKSFLLACAQKIHSEKTEAP